MDKKNNSHLFLAFLVIVLIVGGVWYLKVNSGNPSPSQESSKQNSTPTDPFKDFSFGFDDLKNLRLEDLPQKAGDKWTGLVDKLFTNDKYLFSLKFPMGWIIDPLGADDGYVFKRDDINMAVFGTLIKGYTLETYPSYYFQQISEELGAGVDIRGQMTPFPFGKLKGAAYWITSGDRVAFHVFAEPQTGKFYHAYVGGTAKDVAIYKYILTAMIQTFEETPNKDLSNDRV